MKADNFELFVCGKTGRGNTIFDEFRLELNHILYLALAYTNSRRTIKLFLAHFFRLLKHEAVRIVLAIAVCISYFRDAEQISDTRAAHIHPLAKLAKSWLEKTVWLLVE